MGCFVCRKRALYSARSLGEYLNNFKRGIGITPSLTPPPSTPLPCMGGSVFRKEVSTVRAVQENIKTTLL